METIIGIGSNLGDRLASIRKAILMLAESTNIVVTDYSSVYESIAHVLPNATPQPNYLNAIAILDTALSPKAVLQQCLEIETKLGRVRTLGAAWEPRTLDLDVISMAGVVHSSKQLKLPHHRLAERMFVLKPLAEIRPNLKIPRPFNQTVQYLLDQCLDDLPVEIKMARSTLFS